MKFLFNAVIFSLAIFSIKANPINIGEKPLNFCSEKENGFYEDPTAKGIFRVCENEIQSTFYCPQGKIGTTIDESKKSCVLIPDNSPLMKQKITEMAHDNLKEMNVAGLNIDPKNQNKVGVPNPSSPLNEINNLNNDKNEINHDKNEKSGPTYNIVQSVNNLNYQSNDFYNFNQDVDNYQNNFVASKN